MKSTLLQSTADQNGDYMSMFEDKTTGATVSGCETRIRVDFVAQLPGATYT